MNPQADNDAEALKQRLSQLPQARPSSPLNVPVRPSSGLHDFDDSAFEPEDTPQPAVVRPTPVPPQRTLASPVILPATPAPQFEEPKPELAPVQPASPQLPALPSVQPAPAPVTPPAPPIPAQPTSVPLPPPPAVMPPSSPPPIPQPVAPPQLPPEPPKLPPMPVAPIEHAPAEPTPVFNPAPAPPITPPPTIGHTFNPSPAPAPYVAAPVPDLPDPSSFAAQPVSAAAPAPAAVSYQPPTPHIDKSLIERIDETPQQNSRDIESLIEHNHRLHRLKSFASFLVFCAGVVIAAFLINQFIFQSYYVDGTSMTPTLQNDDRLIIDKVERTWANLQGKPYIPERGQIVVLDSSIVGFNGREEQLIKRVIGLPGDTVIIRDGTVTIKNKLNPDGFDANRQLGLNLSDTFVDSPQEWTIEEGKVFVMGDNRAENGSYDSRAFGPIESHKIVGRLWARILPFEKAQVY